MNLSDTGYTSTTHATRYLASTVFRPVLALPYGGQRNVMRASRRSFYPRERGWVFVKQGGGGYYFFRSKKHMDK